VILRTKVAMLFAASMLAGPASAAWPERPVRIVVPYGPGAMGDLLVRVMADDLRRSLGQPVIVENKAGAGGNIGAAVVAQAPPDGYTLLVGATNNFVINQFLYKQMGFDPIKAFAPITVIADVPSVIFVNAAVPAKTFAELVAYAKANPGKVNFGSPGAGTTPHLTMESINRARRLAMTHVPYKGAGQAMTALLGNEVQVYLVGAGVGMPYLKADKVHALAISGNARLPMLPDVPTFGEAGITMDVRTGNWWGVAAPAGTPPAVLSRLNEAFRAALAAPAVRKRMAELGVIAVGNAPRDMANQLVEESQSWGRAIHDLNITLD